MPGLTPREFNRFLSKPNIARLATLAPDGGPYVNPVWYEWDGSNFFVIARAKSAYLENIRRDPRVALCIDRQKAPFHRVVLEGIAKPTDGDWVDMGTRMTRRYLGKAGPRYLQKTRDRPRVVIRIRPIRVKTWKGAEWHPRYITQRV